MLERTEVEKHVLTIEFLLNTVYKHHKDREWWKGYYQALAWVIEYGPLEENYNARKIEYSGY